MTTTDPAIIIAGLRAQVGSLRDSLRDAYENAATAWENRDVFSAELLAAHTERDALAATLATRTAELADAATELEAFTVESERIVAIVGSGEDDDLLAKIRAVVSERDEALSALTAQSDVLAHAAAKHGEELARVTADRDQASAHVDRTEAIVDGLTMGEWTMLDRTMDIADNLRRVIEKTRAARDEAIQQRNAAECAATEAVEERDSALANLRACEARVAAVEKESDKAAARAKELEARPVLTVEAMAAALRADGYGPDSAIARASELIGHLGAVALPAPITKPRRPASHGGRPMSKTDCPLCLTDGLDLCICDGAAPTTPPAEVFAGVSVEELIDTHEEAYSSTYDERIKAIRDSGERPARMPSRPEIAIRAVLARLKVSLVAPVDPEVVAQELAVRSGSPGTRPYTDATIRAALIAVGVPVTPERGR